MQITDYHAKYYAHELTKRCYSHRLGKLNQSIFSATVNKYLVEIKGCRDLSPTMDETVRDKALAGVRWCEAASSIKGGKPWQYKLIPEDAVAANVDFKFAMAQAVKIT